MNIKTTKQLSLLITFAFLAACSTQNTSVSGSQPGGLLGAQQSTTKDQSSAGGQQSIPGSQLISQQNKDKVCLDKITGKAIPGCKSPLQLASASKAKKLPTVPNTSSKMRKIVLNAPKKTITPRTIVKPAKALPYTSSDVSRTASSIVGKTTSKPRSTMTRRPPAPIRPFRPVVTPTMKPNLRPAIGQTLRRPAPLRRPAVTRRPTSSGIIANPVRSAKPATRPVRRVVKPVVRAPVASPVKKPQSSLRRLTLNGSANFKSGSSRLTSKGQTKLLVLALSLQEGNTRVSRLSIEGHTDSIGNASMNQVLSLKRANAVAEYLASKGGFQRSMMETVGLGESKPVASNKTRKGRALNRRVEISATGTRQITR